MELQRHAIGCHKPGIDERGVAAGSGKEFDHDFLAVKADLEKQAISDGRFTNGRDPPNQFVFVSFVLFVSS
jgi:hypothetical protein